MTDQEEEFESMGSMPGKKIVVNVISMGGEPHPCDLHIPMEQQDYIIRKLCGASC